MPRPLPQGRRAARRPHSTKTVLPPALKTGQTKWRCHPWMVNVSSIFLLLSCGVAINGLGWLSAQFLVNPKSVVWVNAYLPETLQVEIPGWDQPHTLAEINQQLNASGLRMGQSIALTDADAPDIVVPVLAPNDDTCSGDHNLCSQIVELRVYRQTDHPYRQRATPYFRMIDQLPTSGIEHWLVQAPFVEAQVDVPPPSDRPLGFHRIEKLAAGAPKDGTWLTLAGERSKLGKYGQIILYSPKTFTLTVMAPWSSPNGKLPVWENVASGSTAELIVDQTIGLETRYQIQSLQPDSHTPSGLALKPIDLAKPALDSRDYTDALQLARNGLWSLALQQLETLGKETFSQNGSAALQRDMIAYHAKQFKAQADRQSASTSQQVQAYLLDGRWDKAIAVIKSVPTDRGDVLSLLNADSGQLIRRFKTALEITPNNGALQAWNAAATLARNGQARAIAWLKTQPPNRERDQGLTDLAPTLRPSPKPDRIATEKPSTPPIPPANLVKENRLTDTEAADWEVRPVETTQPNPTDQPPD